MGSGPACADRSHRPHWRVFQRNCHHSAFNGYHRAPSDYSSVACFGRDGEIHRVWRTKAEYVAALPDITEKERRDWRVYPVKG